VPHLDEVGESCQPGVLLGELPGSRVAVHQDRAPTGEPCGEQTDVTDPAAQLEQRARGQVRADRGRPHRLLLRPRPWRQHPIVVLDAERTDLDR
jgi:hypothetical protein